ncbi:hypothetical protein B0H17DRAFT_1108102 [Mycena rosella]|uniref:DUF6533 domain-containing protein n=1 Tax=Mycena rosella TaxID=1033263 RepID=A0AAD7FQM4_MYCRO|nr:hypothetical protein B0H17DRAFT_1108102 [Mycena rosella]
MTVISLDIDTLSHDQRLRRSAFLAGLVVLTYDHLLTLGSEVTHIWSAKVKRSAAWFLLFRYTALLSNLTMTAFFLGDFSPESCKTLSSAENYLLVIQEFFVGCTLSIRVCAMYGFNRRVFAALAIAALTTVSLGAWAIVGPTISIDTDLPGCHVTTPRQQAIRVAAAWEAQLVCDILILGLTLRRAYTYHRTVGLRSGSLLPIMVRDGAVYFGMICLVNLANIVMLYAGDIITAGSLAWFASAISVTMISRLMLNLHDAARGSSRNGVFTDHEMEPIRFHRPT